MKDPYKPFRVLAAFRGLKSLSRDNYQGSTQAGSSRHGKKPVVSWLHLDGSNPYHRAIFSTGQSLRIHDMSLILLIVFKDKRCSKVCFMIHVKSAYSSH